ncbi:DUF418 domain-containing protein [Nesterenkonia populi]
MSAEHEESQNGAPTSAQAHTAPASSASPVRLHAVDALRALALLGIVSVNVWFFARPDTIVGALTGELDTAQPTGADQVVRFTSSLLFEGKSYVVFSFLFGLSFVLAWARAAETGASEARRSLRRSAALIVLGALHGIFLFFGDILLAYGILGMLLLAVRRISAKPALIIAGCLYALVMAVVLGSAALMAMMDAAAGGDAMGGGFDFGLSAEDVTEAYTGSIGSYLLYQLIAWIVMVFNILLGQGPLAFAAFLVGLVVGRARLIERLLAGEFATGRLLAMALPALAFGLLVSGLGSWLAWGPPGTAGHDGGAWAMMGQALALAAGPIQSFGYVVVLLLAFRSGAFDWLVRLLAPAGRMSLTNYLLQSLVLMLIFAAPGLGLAGQLEAGAVGGIVLALWAAQLLVSHLWFAKFKRGPLEAPVRAWTYREKA